MWPGYSNNSNYYEQERKQFIRESISQPLNLNEEIFGVSFEKRKNTIFILCKPKDGAICLYVYYIEISYEEFCKLGKTFKLCENINEIFEIIRNIIEEVKFTNKKGSDVKSNIRIEYGEYNDDIMLILNIPLLIGTYEEIKIEFRKIKKDINFQFKKLKKKYLKLKTMVINNEIKELRNEFKSEIKNRKNNCENHNMILIMILILMIFYKMILFGSDEF